MKRHPPAVEAMVADAAALAQVIAWKDFPRGFVVIAEPLPERFLGVSVGGGAGMAAVYGDRCGRGSVWVDPDKFTFGADEPTPDMVAGFTSTVLHELGHAVTEADVPDADTARVILDPSTAFPESTADALATWHSPRWAGACAVLLARAMPLRRSIADAIRAGMRRSVGKYGFDLDDVVAAVADFPTAGRLRDVLAVGGEWDQRLAERMPSMETRLAAIAEAFALRPEGERAVA